MSPFRRGRFESDATIGSRSTIAREAAMSVPLERRRIRCSSKRSTCIVITHGRRALSKIQHTAGQPLVPTPVASYKRKLFAYGGIFPW